MADAPTGPIPADRALSDARSLLTAQEETTRLRGVHALRDDVPDRAAAATALIDALLDSGSYVPHAARAALQDLGDDALPALLAGLGSPSPVVRAGCVWALAREQSADVSGAVAALVADAETSVREAVAGALGRIGGATARRQTLLVNLCTDPNPRVRTQGVQSLGLLTEHSDAGRRALADALEDARPGVRIAAVEALTSVTPDESLVADVARALDDEPTEQVAAPLRALLERWRADA